MVIATQNPVEFEGPSLPEAQLDRFLPGLPALPHARGGTENTGQDGGEHPITQVQPVVEAEDILGFIQAKQRVFVEESLRNYLLELATGQGTIRI